MPSKSKRVLVLGSSGSIGTQTVDVIKKNPDDLELVGLACGTRADVALSQARELGVSNIALGKQPSDDMKDDIESYVRSAGGYFGVGDKAVLALIEECEPDIVVNSLVGAHGMKASYETLKAGKVLALANKESLVVAGDLIMPLANSLESSDPLDLADGRPEAAAGTFRPLGYLMPIDSEHGAIYQCLLGEDVEEVERLWVTASGGPFRGRTRSDLLDVTSKDALAHPTWNMGAKITIDSSTLMNKGLEVIEAHHLFDMPYERIEVVVQPQSAIHSMVEYVDGSVKAHLGATDMRIPIQFALSYPKRWESPVERLDFRKLGSIDFEEPDMETFKALAIAREVGKAGGTLPCAMNAANEVAVASFLSGRCSFLDIADCVEYVVDHVVCENVESIDQLEEVDRVARKRAEEYLGGRR